MDICFSSWLPKLNGQLERTRTALTQVAKNGHCNEINSIVFSTKPDVAAIAIFWSHWHFITTKGFDIGFQYYCCSPKGLSVQMKIYAKASS